MDFGSACAQSFFILLTIAVTLARGAVHNVTLPGKMVLVPGASAYLLGIGEVVGDVANISFAFDTPLTQPVLLYTFRHFNLPNLNFNTHDFCADFECLLTNRKGISISDIKASCKDNSNPQLHGPIVTVPEATNVSCSIIWNYPLDKSYLNGSVQIVFVSAYNGECWDNSSSWCNVKLDSLVDPDYENIQRPLCLERTVAAEVFNATCSYPTEHPSPYSPLIYVVIFISVLAFLLAMLIGFCIYKCIKRRKICKIPITTESQTNGRPMNAIAASWLGEDSPLSSEPNMDVNSKERYYFPLASEEQAYEQRCNPSA